MQHVLVRRSEKEGLNTYNLSEAVCVDALKAEWGVMMPLLLQWHPRVTAVFPRPKWHGECPDDGSAMLEQRSSAEHCATASLILDAYQAELME